MALYYSPDNLITATEGDLIEFRRLLFFGFGYCHFAVCTVDSEADFRAAVQTSRAVGDRFTIGVDSPWINIRRKCLLTRIVEKTIRNLCDGHDGGWRVNNLDAAARAKGLRPFRPDVIVERARGFLMEDRLIVYSLITDNCEHFATKCRYGQPFSLQVSDFRTATVRYVLTMISAIRHAYYSRRRPEIYILGRTIDEVTQNETV
ncbi:phospholipase A and acyltransferase 2-like [Daphnia pulicaria]|uniref:phospholipase A and acyltransferase 2-like n=1 Tax=Daphnia pulicaria TaxID=35523 RepID=UPI001EEAFF5C|nr:phospholipase A and acyltransferase 2-like [Daphnia pulicaria]